MPKKLAKALREGVWKTSWNFRALLFLKLSAPRESSVGLHLKETRATGSQRKYSKRNGSQRHHDRSAQKKGSGEFLVLAPFDVRQSHDQESGGSERTYRKTRGHLTQQRLVPSLRAAQLGRSQFPLIFAFLGNAGFKKVMIQDAHHTPSSHSRG